jgi:hypothetical protein
LRTCMIKLIPYEAGRPLQIDAYHMHDHARGVCDATRRFRFFNPSQLFFRVTSCFVLVIFRYSLGASVSV